MLRSGTDDGEFSACFFNQRLQHQGCDPVWQESSLIGPTAFSRMDETSAFVLMPLIVWAVHVDASCDAQFSQQICKRLCFCSPPFLWLALMISFVSSGGRQLYHVESRSPQATAHSTATSTQWGVKFTISVTKASGWRAAAPSPPSVWRTECGATPPTPLSAYVSVPPQPPALGPSLFLCQRHVKISCLIEPPQSVHFSFNPPLVKITQDR